MKKPNEVNDSDEVQEMMEQPDCYILGNRHMSDKAIGFKRVLAWHLQPDQLAHTKEEIANAAEGVRKLVSMLIPRSDIEILQKYEAVGYPEELVEVLVNTKEHETGFTYYGELEEPLNELADLTSFIVPLNFCREEDRPTGQMYDNFERQMARVVAAVDSHGSRLMTRVDAYMTGRPLVTARQRHLDAVMDTYHELDWENDYLPYITLEDRD